MENSQLNIQLKEGNPAAFEELFKYTFARMLNYCRLFIQDQDQGNDLVQEFFVRLWKKRSTIKPTNSIENLLFVMLRNRCLNFFCDQNMQSIAKNIRSIGNNVYFRIQCYLAFGQERVPDPIRGEMNFHI